MKYLVEKSKLFHLSPKGIGMYKDPGFLNEYDGGWFETSNDDIVINTTWHDFDNGFDLLDFFDEEEFSEGLISEEEEKEGDFRNIPSILYADRSGIESMQIRNITYLGYSYIRYTIHEMK